MANANPVKDTNPAPANTNPPNTPPSPTNSSNPLAVPGAVVKSGSVTVQTF